MGMRGRRRTMAPLFLALAVSAFAQGIPEDELRERILETAEKYKGTPYMYGAESPSAFDCSGFVRYVYREAAGIELPRSSKGIYAAGVPVAAGDAKPGDVFIYDTVGGSPSHVSIYLGNGSVTHAVSEGPRTGVIVSPATDRYFPPRFIAARSFLAGPTAGRKDSQKAAPRAPGPAQSPKPEAPSPVAAAPKAAAPKPATPSEKPPVAPGIAEAEVPIADIGFSIPREPASYTDRIPAATGTGMAFTLRNDTGKDGTFIVLFYKTDPKFSQSREIHREKAVIKAGKTFTLPAYRFMEAGIYKLIVKDNWNTQLMERVFRVTEPAK